jgi:hypothetical protein
MACSWRSHAEDTTSLHCPARSLFQSTALEISDNDMSPVHYTAFLIGQTRLGRPQAPDVWSLMQPDLRKFGGDRRARSRYYNQSETYEGDSAQIQSSATAAHAKLDDLTKTVNVLRIRLVAATQAKDTATANKQRRKVRQKLYPVVIRTASDFTRPGKPTDSGHIESFNGRLRDECLNVHQFLSLEHAQRVIEASRRDCNEQRPHSALGGLTPCAFIQSHQAQQTITTR